MFTSARSMFSNPAEAGPATTLDDFCLCLARIAACSNVRQLHELTDKTPCLEAIALAQLPPPSSHEASATVKRSGYSEYTAGWVVSLDVHAPSWRRKSFEQESRT